MRTSSVLVLLAALAAASCDDKAPAPPVGSPGSASPAASAAPPVTATATAPASASATAAVPGPTTRVTDAIKTSTCEARVTPLRHATFLLVCGDLAIYADPVKDVSYDGLPKAG